MFESGLAILVLIKIEKITPFIKLHKGTGDGYTGSGDPFDVPAFCFAGSVTASWIEPHGFPVQTETGAQQKIDSQERDKNYNHDKKSERKAV
jgi:hypothetical protein